MEISNSISKEQVEPGRLLGALASIECLSGTFPDPASGPIVASADVLPPLQDATKRIQDEVANFLNAFPTTAKALTKEKKDALLILSPELKILKKEFRLPCRSEVKGSEAKRASEAWISFKHVHTDAASRLARTTVEMLKASGDDVPETVSWEEEEKKEVSDAIKLATDQLLLSSILVKHVYALTLAKAHLEVIHRPYLEAFEALKNHQIKKRLKIIRRRAEYSSDLKKEALELLAEEERNYHEIEDKWISEEGKWMDSEGNSAQALLKRQQEGIDRALGTSSLEILLPAITSATKDLIAVHLDFVPNIGAIEAGLINHGEEAEEISEKLYEELRQIRQAIGVQATPNNPTPSMEYQSTPKKKCVAFAIEEETLLSHEITSLGVALRRLKTTLRRASEERNDQSIEMLRATLDMIKTKKVMNLREGDGEQVKEAYTLLDETEEEITKASAALSLAEKRERNKKEEERTKGIMAAKSLPHTRIPQFSGRLEDFWEWLPQFQAACPLSLPPEMRAGHLRQALRDPTTLDMISGCETIEEMEDELRRNFGSKEEELNRLIQTLDTMPRSKNGFEELINLEKIRKIRRKLRSIKEEGVLDKLRLRRVTREAFLPRTREEFLKKLHTRRAELIMNYSQREGIELQEAKTLSLREGLPEVDVSEEDYVGIFWDFLETKAEVGRAMRADSKSTGLMRSNEVIRSNMIDPSQGYGNEQRLLQMKCNFKNCGKEDHFTRRCDKNLKPGEVPDNIQQLCVDANLCLRCLRDLSYVKHEETCLGGYKSYKDNKWIGTDCKTCTVLLSNGRRIKLNKRICHHVIGDIMKRRQQRQAVTATSNLIQNEEVDEMEVPTAMVCSSATTSISNKLMINRIPCGEASQLAEWLPVKVSDKDHPVLAMYDLGTSCSVIDNGLARRLGFKKMSTQFTISTVTGVQDGSNLYSFTILNSDNQEIKVQALGIDIRQHYPMIRIKVRKPWRDYFGGQSHQRASGGCLGLLLGSDQSRLHPRQVSFSRENEVLWRSYLTGRYLISGGRNETADRPTINRISVDLPKDLPKKTNLNKKVTTSRVQDGRVITIKEDMKEKIFKQLTGIDSVLVSPCTACQVCREQTDRMAEQDVLEFEALRKTVSFDEEKGRYKGDFLYLEDKVGQVRCNSNFAKKNSENLHRKLSKLPAELVKDFDEALECAKEMGALKKTAEVEGLKEGYPQRHIPINFAFSGKESSTKIRPTFNCGWSGGNGDPSFNDVHLVGPRNLNNLDQSMLFFKTNSIVGLIDVKKFFWTCLVSPRTASLNRIWLPEGGYSGAKEGEV